MVTTEEGALLAKDMVLAAIKTTELANTTNNYNYISNILKTNCSNFLGDSNTVYYQVNTFFSTFLCVCMNRY